MIVLASYPVVCTEESRWLDVFEFSRKHLTENAWKSNTHVKILRTKTILSVFIISDIIHWINIFLFIWKSYHKTLFHLLIILMHCQFLSPQQTIVSLSPSDTRKSISMFPGTVYCHMCNVWNKCKVCRKWYY